MPKVNVNPNYYGHSTFPEQEQTTKLPSLKHLPPDKHQTIWVQSKFDPACQRCSMINKVIQLRRRSLTNGASLFEAQSAQRIASELVEKHQLTQAETLDRLYTSPTQSPKAKAEAKKPRRKATMEEI